MSFAVCLFAADDSSGSDSDEGTPQISSAQLRACCKQKARRPVSDVTESSDEDEEKDTPLESSCEEEEDVSEASESADVSASGFLDDEAMEVELSSEEWEEGSGESEVEEESEEEEGGGSGFIVDEAMDEEVYQARKRCRARILSDDDDDDQLGKEARIEISDDDEEEEEVVLSDDGADTDEDKETSNKPQQIGGLFQLAKKQALTVFHREDSSLVRVQDPSPSPLLRDWTNDIVVSAAKCLFVTGSWGEDSAQALLDEDDALYGDFEDMEKEGGETQEEGEEVDSEKQRLERKKKLKADFDVGYDEKEGEGGGSSYLEDLKKEVSEQERRNRAEFEGMDEHTRLQFEGVRPGYYVRLELRGN